MFKKSLKKKKKELCLARFIVCFKQFLNLALVFSSRGFAQQVPSLIVRGDGKMHYWVGGREGVPVTPHEGQSDLNQKYTLLLPPAGENFQDAWPMAKSPSAIIETPPTWIQASKRQAEEMIYEIPTCMQQPQLERSHFSAVQDASASSFLS